MRAERILIAASLLMLAGCGGRHPYERVVVVGIVTPIDAPLPAPGIRRQQLPPLVGQPIAPDTSDGGVLIEIDQQRFVRDHGYELPEWQPPRAPSPDLHLGDFEHLVDDLRAIRRQLDDVPVPPADDASSRGAGEPTDRSAMLVLREADWSAIVARVLVLGGAIDRLVADSPQLAIDGAPIDGLDGDATHARLEGSLWAGLDARAEALATAAQALASDGAFARLRHHPRHGDACEHLLGDVRAHADAIAAVVHAHDAPALITSLRLAEEALVRLERAPVSTLALGAMHDGDVAITADECAQTRLRLAAMHHAIVGLATQWAGNRSALLPHQPRPTVVYRRAATVD